MVLKQLVVFADSDVSLRLETVADQAAISSNTVTPAPLRIRRSTIKDLLFNNTEILLSIDVKDIPLFLLIHKSTLAFMKQITKTSY